MNKNRSGWRFYILIRVKPDPTLPTMHLESMSHVCLCICLSWLWRQALRMSTRRSIWTIGVNTRRHRTRSLWPSTNVSRGWWKSPTARQKQLVRRWCQKAVEDFIYLFFWCYYFALLCVCPFVVGRAGVQQDLGRVAVLGWNWRRCNSRAELSGLLRRFWPSW